MMNNAGLRIRKSFLEETSINFDHILNSKLEMRDVQNNIESFIGAIEIPVGLVGPLLFRNNRDESVYGAVATTEGALVASMNRGAKAVSESGGFWARFINQKMLRAPMFRFGSAVEAVRFGEWVRLNFREIKKVCETHSNHAELLDIEIVQIKEAVHLRFIYKTGDASGQNMSTNCTWHACLWIQKQAISDNSFMILDFIIEANGASDKKITEYSLRRGRGCRVEAHCVLTHEVLQRVLRTTTEDMVRCFGHSREMARHDGMIGHNINVANAIAAFFAATGQDLASVHESSVGVLEMEPSKEGLKVALSLLNLVIGTVGGGTGLPGQKSILRLMGCDGGNRVERFAEIICGYSMALEISTMAAVVSGQFARSHQKLGRNKPRQWLLKSEINKDYINRIFGSEMCVQDVYLEDDWKADNGILSELSGRFCNKIQGFLPLKVGFPDGLVRPMLIKSKSSDRDVLKGMHLLATAVDSKLSDELITRWPHLEYHNSGIKEIVVYEKLKALEYSFMPKYYGSHVDEERDICLFVMERLVESDLMLYNSENEPDLWSETFVLSAIDAISLAHSKLLLNTEPLRYIKPFVSRRGLPLYASLNSLLKLDYAQNGFECYFKKIDSRLHDEGAHSTRKTTPLTIVHNDFNPRNIAVDKNSKPYIYDWELVCYNVPQRDLVELLSFTLHPDLRLQELMHYIEHHYNRFREETFLDIDFNDWVSDFITVGYEYLYTRGAFYLAGHKVAHYPFAVRVCRTAMRMLELLEERW